MYVCVFIYIYIDVYLHMFGRKPMESSTFLGGKEPKQSKSFRVDFA